MSSQASCECIGASAVTLSSSPRAPLDFLVHDRAMGFQSNCSKCGDTIHRAGRSAKLGIAHVVASPSLGSLVVIEQGSSIMRDRRPVLFMVIVLCLLTCCVAILAFVCWLPCLPFCPGVSSRYAWFTQSLLQFVKAVKLRDFFGKVVRTICIMCEYGRECLPDT